MKGDIVIMLSMRREIGYLNPSIKIKIVLKVRRKINVKQKGYDGCQTQTFLI